MLKRNAIILFLIIAIVLLIACSTKSKNTSPEKLIDNYLSAIHKVDYEAIWNMIPKEIQDYVNTRKKEIQENFDIKIDYDGARIVYNNIQKNQDFNELALASCENYKYNIITRRLIESGDIAYAKEYLQKIGIELEIQDIAQFDVVVATEKTQKDISIFMIKVADEWYLTSGDGDDVVLGEY